MPDLIVWGPPASPFESIETFLPTDCDVVEGIVQAGTRKLLRFGAES
jgi:hypothetical protein